ncbi:MAG: NAD(P)-dependent oxidoreductase [Erysipelotrichaceae bacterium]|nr:NAD(P)-dependent oxidoreductase [Erysipelotrichaceae bacterium]
MILVTGGNGNIGKAVCNELGKRGYQVISVGRRKMDADLYRHVSCDITVKEDLDRLFKEYRFDVIFHLAGLTNTAAKNDPQKAVEINVNGSMNLMKKAIEYSVPFVYGSSVNAIGLADTSEEGVKESDLSQPQEFYGWTKRFTEEMGIALSNVSGLSFTSLRIPNVLGKGQGSVNTPWRETCFTQIGHGGDLLITYRSNSRIPAIHISDLTNAICEVLTSDKPRRQVYNLPAEEISIEKLSNYLMEIDPELHVTTGEKEPKGMCSHIDWSRFKEDYPIRIHSLKERLQEAYEENRK